MFRRMRAVLSIRLHPLIFGAGQGIPVAGIVYDPKVQGFLEDLGCKAYCTIDELTAGRADALLDQALTAGPCDAASLRERAEQNIETVMTYLNIRR